MLGLFLPQTRRTFVEERSETEETVLAPPGIAVTARAEFRHRGIRFMVSSAPTLSQSTALTHQEKSAA